MKPKIGAHVSVAGGIDKAPGRAAQEGCETFQCFTRSPQGGPAQELDKPVITAFKSQMKSNGFNSFYIHAPYYINLASPNNRIWHSSVSVLSDELERGSMLGAKFVMAHMGSHMGISREEGIKRVTKGLNAILNDYDGSTKFLIEISAGSGCVVGDTFEEIAEMMNSVITNPGFGGVCFDTCHAFASGYDFTNPELAREMLHAFDSIIGLKYLRMTQVNDSKFGLNSRKDRHEHVGDGYIGIEGLRALLRSKPFLSFDWLLETKDDKRKEDIEKLKKIRNN